MYSGLLPKDLTEDDLSPDEEEKDEPENDVVENLSAGNLSHVAENTGFPDDGKSTQIRNDVDDDSRTCSMPGISEEMWQKFQVLRKKKDEIKTTKIHERRKRRRKKDGLLLETLPAHRQRQDGREKHWKELKQYFGVNDRFQPPACSKPPPKSGLEKSMEEAVAEGDIAKAEEMSDRLASREMAVQIAQAADCRDFVHRKQEEEALRAARKRKRQIAWGAKQRWETKSNMGFM
uniref:Family with sequence similarity 204 member A n=1 Tax=Poecilia formosa TaxID=48698 RepID=A0A096LVZ3_POEFO